MIVYDLTCAVGHRFESWFQNAAAFDAQREESVVECPFCGDRDISKAPMAPRVSRGIGGPLPGENSESSSGATDEGSAPPSLPAAAVPQPPPVMFEVLRRLRRHVEENCEYVGPAFPEQARRIFYGEVAPRGIYGEASTEEADALKEEGIETQRIPWLPRRNG